jgi:hypothetical protein
MELWTLLEYNKIFNEKFALIVFWVSHFNKNTYVPARLKYYFKVVFVEKVARVNNRPKGENLPWLATHDTMLHNGKK